MSDEYAFAGKRKTRGDKRAKARFMRYKKGGQFRAANVQITGSKEEGKR